MGGYRTFLPARTTRSRGRRATVSQARALDEDLEENGAGSLSRVICLEGPSEAELVERVIPGRRTSKATGEVYHLENDPPPKPEEMMDPGPFSERKDHTEEATRAHLETYRKEEGALKSRYEAEDQLTVVDASRPMEEVTAEIQGALGHPKRPEYYASSQRV